VKSSKWDERTTHDENKNYVQKLAESTAIKKIKIGDLSLKIFFTRNKLGQRIKLEEKKKEIRKRDLI
jgi:replication initiation and membrane attachment protein DnaB